MNFEKFLFYVTHNVEILIQWQIAVLLGIGALILLMYLLRKKSVTVHTENSAASTEIQEKLEKLLEQTAKLQNLQVSEATPADAADIDEKVQDLKRQLSEREAEIGVLKAAGDTKTSGATGAAEELSVKIKDLEAKLAEYSILEEDIADLSLFKEENQRLKTEIEQIKASGQVPASPPPVEPVAAAVEELATLDAAKANDIVSEFAQAIQKPDEPAAAPAPAAFAPPEPLPGAEPAPAAPEPVAAAPAAPPPAAAAPAPTPAPAPVAATAPPVDTIAAAKASPFSNTAAPPAQAAAAAISNATAAAPEADDLFAEFAIEAPPEDGLDTSKMEAELAALSSLEPTSEDSLQGAIDTDKMAAEATKLS